MTSIKHPAQGPFCGECGTPAASQWRGSAPPEEERIRRDARNAALEEAAEDCDRQAVAVGTSESASVAYRVAASRIRAMKVEVPRE